MMYSHAAAMYAAVVPRMRGTPPSCLVRRAMRATGKVRPALAVFERLFEGACLSVDVGCREAVVMEVYSQCGAVFGFEKVRAIASSLLRSL